MENKEYYRRNLPHYQPLEGTFFVTFSLWGAIPKKVYQQLQTEYFQEKEKLASCKSTSEDFVKLRKKYFRRHDNFFDSMAQGNHFLTKEAIAALVAETLKYWDNQKYDLICYCIMSNHVHFVVRLLDRTEVERPVYLNQVLQSIKRHSAREANKILLTQGQFWQRESFDYQVRNREELCRIVKYVLFNPVQAGICENMSDWKWSYIKEKYNEFV